MINKVNIIGYSPQNLNYCPECGAEHFPNAIWFDGSMECEECGLVCYIVESERSHAGNFAESEDGDE